ncbi:hypothetical protein, partial [Chamaesiphon sp. VAR_69_metabat_338]|uniref:hypothetical protein n=1 Tax=Chamaesiphon sp. VAR_69_metabat_338 TaxID=2964704 RepID=UPI00286DCCC6
VERVKTQSVAVLQSDERSVFLRVYSWKIHLTECSYRYERTRHKLQTIVRAIKLRLKLKLDLKVRSWRSPKFCCFEC